MKHTHTPGPWEVVDDADIYAPGVDMTIGYMDIDQGSGVEDRANARLAAASPELLAVAERAVAYYGGPADGDWGNLHDDDVVASTISLRVGDIRAARAAVAKATDGAGS